MKILLSPIFIICIIVFVIHQLLLKVFNITIPYVDDYLDCLLAMPVILSLLLLERRMLFKKGNEYHLSVLEIVIATIYVAFVVEIIFPLLSHKFTADWMDFLFLFAGSFIYWIVNRKQRNKS